MPADKGIYKNITEVSIDTPEPKRAQANLLRLMDTAPERERFMPYFKETAKLFSVSQFLSNFCISNPDELLNALKTIKEPITKEFLSERGGEELTFMSSEGSDITNIMKRIRLFKKRYLLRITLRDIMGETDILASMDELTCLAEIIVRFALSSSLKINARKFGDPSSDEEPCLVALGKLGGEELNYSSDVDLMAVYATEEGQTSGILSPSGTRINRINNNEFYFKVIELFNKALSVNTEDGIAYRVDFRLRPQGERGEIALPLRAYQAYYETWGRTWERMALIRSRPVAGSDPLGRKFMRMIEPFVWLKTIDYSEIEEIKALKKKIDSTFLKDDIKHGYGGIREAEFFIQTFQLMFGKEHAGVRTHRLLNAVQSLRWTGIIPEEDLVALQDNYLYLRRLEHLLQMKDDLQTHSLPASKDDLHALARKMDFPSSGIFRSDLQLRRMKIRNMYNSLLGTETDIHAEILTLLEGELSDGELLEYLSFRRLKKPSEGVQNLKGISVQFEAFRTQREVTVMRKVIPSLIEKALNAESPDRALKGLESFFTTFGIRETYLSGLTERKELKDGIIKILSLSTYLTRIFLSSPRYIDLLLEGNVIRKTLRRTGEEIERITRGKYFETKIAEYKNAEEIRLGSFFLMRVINVFDLNRYLSHLAEAVINVTTERLLTPTPLKPRLNPSVSPLGKGGIERGTGFSVLGLGKLGGREITFGSDLDIIFLSKRPGDLKIAEKLIKTLTAYTDKGIIYNIDMGLRPDGSKGVLLKDLEGYRNYYFSAAHPWEIQSLLKSRPVAGDKALSESFMKMTHEVILKRGMELRINDVKTMRERIIKELSHESKGIDIKLGPGGIEEIEFYVQWLQLHHAGDAPEILVQDTVSAIRRLIKKGLLSPDDGKDLSSSYGYMRTLETFMRLNEEHVITEDSEFTGLACIFMGHKDREGFLSYLKTLRTRVLDVLQR